MDETQELTGHDFDRGAMDLLIGWFPPLEPIDAYEISVERLNVVWSQMARRLAALPHEEVSTILPAAARADEIAQADAAGIGRKKDQRSEELRFVAGRANRALELVGLIVEWRHGTWEAAEIAAGRDPHRVAAPGV